MPANATRPKAKTKQPVPSGIDPDFADLYRATLAEVREVSGATDVDAEMIKAYVICAQSAARWREAEQRLLRESQRLAAVDKETVRQKKEMFVAAQQAGASAGKSRATANGIARLLKLSPSERGAKASKAISAKGASAGGSLAEDLA